MTVPPADQAGTELPRRQLSRRLLQVGFLFFLAKGVAWLILGWLAWKAA
jgi:hypothetical protein